MGARISKRKRDQQRNLLRSNEIDRMLEEDNKRLKRKCTILLLGSEESGKDRLVDQMKTFHQGRFTTEEFLEYRPIIYSNVIEAACSIVVHMLRAGIECKEATNKPLMEKILNHSPEPYSASDIQFSPEIAQVIHQLLKDPAVVKMIEDHAGEFYLPDSANYFLCYVLRIGAPDYVPTKFDILHARPKRRGTTETQFNMGQLMIRIVDVDSRRSELRKWIHCFESATSIMFCTALTEYDQYLEHKSQTRMQESLELFESIINSRWFTRASIILFLTKFNVFKTKLAKVPLDEFFEEYTGGIDVNKAAKYILWKFMSANRGRLSIYPHLTQDTDTTNIHLVFTSVKETILQNAVRSSASGIL